MKLLQFKRVIIISLSAFLLSSCSSALKASYKVSLEDVSPSKSFSKTKSIPVLTESTEKLSFEDEFINIEFFPISKVFEFKLKNKSNSTIKLIWNDAVFVDTDNQNYRVINGQTKFVNDEKEIPSTSIISQGNLEDFIYPSGWAYYNNIGTIYGINASSWKLPPLFPIYIRGNNQKLKNKYVDIYQNKTMKILLPFLIKDNKVEYIFTFKVDDFKLEDH